MLPERLRNGLLLVGGYHSELRAVTQPAVEEAMEAAGVRDEVTITGYVDREAVKSYLQKMSVFVLSSTQEGQPNALLEAAAAGLPIVSTAVDGINDTFRHEESALLTPIGDAPALACAIARLLEDTALAKRLSRGAKSVAASLDSSSETQQWPDLYRSLLRRSTPSTH
jgi:glycosyltransferase involved in cell wall biosynthesis